jgi:hypothetical protein
VEDAAYAGGEPGGGAMTRTDRILYWLICLVLALDLLRCCEVAQG